MTTAVYPVFVAIPLGAAFLIPVIARRRKGLAEGLANSATLVLLAASLAVMILGIRGAYVIGGWRPPYGIVWSLDGLGILMLVVVNLVSFASTLYSIPYMKGYTGHAKYYSLFLLMVAGMNGVVMTADLFNLFVFLEVASFASYALVAFGCEHEELEASFKYLVLGSVGSTFVLFAIALLYGTTGYLTMANISEAVRGSGKPLVLVIVTIFFIAGFGIKAALVPFHPWLPDAHPSAPAPISAMLSGVLIKALGIYALARVFFNVLGMDRLTGIVLVTVGGLSMTVGVLLAVGQWDLKRLLAYHSISQMGYVVLGVGFGGYLLSTGGNTAAASLSILGGIFHLANHSVFKSLLFFCAGSIEHATGTRQLKEMGGLSSRMPLTRAASTIAALSISGVPPFNGFWSKLLIVVAAFQAGFIGLALMTIAVSFVTLVSFLKVLRYAFLGDLPDALREVRESPPLMIVPLVFLAILCVGMGLLLVPAVREAVMDPAVAVLVNGGAYARTVVAAFAGR